MLLEAVYKVNKRQYDTSLFEFSNKTIIHVHYIWYIYVRLDWIIKREEYT